MRIRRDAGAQDGCIQPGSSVRIADSGGLGDGPGSGNRAGAGCAEPGVNGPRARLIGCAGRSTVGRQIRTPWLAPFCPAVVSALDHVG